MPAQAVASTEFMDNLNNQLPSEESALGGLATALSQSPSACRSLADAMPVAIAVRDLEGVLVWANRRWSELARWPVAEAVGQSWTRTVHPHDREQIADDWERVLKREGIAEVGYRLQVNGDESLWVRSTWFAVRDERGRFVSVLEVTNERVLPSRAITELGRSEQRYLQLLAAVTSYRYSVQVRNGLPVATEHSQGCLAATGYAPHEYAADPGLWISMVHPEDRELVRDHVARVLRAERVPPLEHRIVRKDGVVRWIRDTIVSHEDERRHLLRYDGLVEDVTDRKQAEERCKRMLESAPDAMVVVDPQGRLCWSIRKRSTSSVIPCAQLLGKSVELLIPERFRGQHAKMREAFSAAPSFRSMSHRPTLFEVPRDGSEFPAEISLSPIETDGGTYVSAAIRDITERQRVQNELATNYQIQAVIKRAAAVVARADLLGGPTAAVARSAVLGWLDWSGGQGGHLPAGCIHRGVTPRRAPRLAGAAADVGARVALGTCLCGQAAATREIVYVEQVNDRHITQYPGIRSHGHYCVPILLEGQLLGVLNLYVASGHRSSPEESRFLRRSPTCWRVNPPQADRASVQRAGSAAHRRAADPGASSPPGGSGRAGHRIGRRSYAAEYTAGDYFDYLQLADGTLGIVIGDVSGHGFSTGLLMASVSGSAPVAVGGHFRCLRDPHPGQCIAGERDGSRAVRDADAAAVRSPVADDRVCHRGTPGGVCAGRGRQNEGRVGKHGAAAGDLAGCRVPPQGPGATRRRRRRAADDRWAGRSPIACRRDVRRTARPQIFASACRQSPQEIIARLHAAVCEFSGTSELRDDVTAVVLKVT